MGHIWVEQQGEQACFLKNDKNQYLIEFSDPAYARAEMILFEPSTRHAHAVLHEGVHFIGEVPRNLGDDFGKSGEILLQAHHFDGHRVELRAAISVL